MNTNTDHLTGAVPSEVNKTALPELPEHVVHLHSGISVWPVELYTADQMREYATSAVLAERDRWHSLPSSLVEAVREGCEAIILGDVAKARLAVEKIDAALDDNGVPRAAREA